VGAEHRDYLPHGGRGGMLRHRREGPHPKHALPREAWVRCVSQRKSAIACLPHPSLRPLVLLSILTLTRLSRKRMNSRRSLGTGPSTSHAIVGCRKAASSLQKRRKCLVSLLRRSRWIGTLTAGEKVFQSIRRHCLVCGECLLRLLPGKSG